MKEDAKKDATLIILTRNEIKGIKALFNKIPIHAVKEVIGIDYNSTDGTVEFLKKRNIRVIPQKKKGRAEAFRIGCRNAKYENVIFFSPDGNENPADIEKLIFWLEQGYDMAIASRFMKESKAEKEDIVPIRSFGNVFFTKVADLIWHAKLTDSINGFRGIKKKVFWELNPDTEGFGIEFQLSIRALKKHFKIKEIPTVEGGRIGGLSTAETFQTGWLFVKLIAKELMVGNRYKAP